VIGVGQDITKLKSSQEQHQRVADDLTRLIDTANAPIFGIDTEGRVTEWNGKAAEITGYGKNETLMKPLVDTFITREYREDVGRVLSLAMEGKESANFEFPLYSKDGLKRDILLNATTRRGSAGEVIGVIGVGQDITGLKETQAEQQRVADDLTRLIDTANAPIFGIDVNGCVTEWNRKAAEIVGFGKEETLGKPLVETFISPEYWKDVGQVLTMALEGIETANFEFPLFTKDGERREILLNATTRRGANEEVVGVIGVGQDITKLKSTQAEQQRVADDLTRLIDTANAPIFGIDREGRVTEWNGKAAEISGFGKEETLGKPLVTTFIAPLYQQDVDQVLTKALEGSETANFEFPLFTKNGERREILLNATTRRGANGEVTGVIGVGQDITKLKSSQAEHQRVADDLSRLIETANAPIFGVDVEGRVTEWNRKLAELTGFPIEKTLGHVLVEEFTTVDFKDKMEAVLASACEGDETANIEFPLLTTTGQQLDVLLNATTRRDANGRVTGVVGVGQDITNLTRAMVETTRVAEDLTRLIDTANAPIFGIDTEGRVTEWNGKAAEITGYGKNETLMKPLVDTFITREYREDVGRVLSLAMEGKESANFEFPLYSKDGQKRDILLNATTRRGSAGEVIGVIGVGQDITGLKEIQAEQQRVADDLTRLIDTANAPIFGIDTKGCVTEWNRKAAEIVGFGKEETLGKPLVETFITPQYWKDVGEVLTRALEGSETANFEFPLFTKSGERREILLNATTRRDANDEVTGVIGVGQDITGLKAVQAEAQRVADDLSRLIETANAPIFGVDLEGRVTEWNKMAAELTGYTPEETMGHILVDEFIAADYKAKVMEVLNRACVGEETANFEFPLYGKDGNQFDVLLNATTRKDANGSITGMVGVGQDITNLKAAMSATKRVADDMTRLIDTANAPIFGVDLDGHVTEWNRKAAEVSGWAKEEALGKPLLHTFIPKQNWTGVQEVLTLAFDGISTANFEFPIITSDQAHREVLLNATTRRGANDEVIGVIGVGQDITELNEQRREVERIADDLSRLVETANAPIIGINRQGEVTDWNLKVAEISGYSRDFVLGKPLITNFIPEPYRAEIAYVLLEALGGEETANFEFPLFTKAGERRDVLMNATTRRGPDDSVIGVIGVGHDITDLRRVHAAQIREAEDMAQLIRSANAPIFGVYVNGNIMEWNEKIAMLTGFDKVDTLGKPFVAEFVAGESKGLVETVINGLMGGTPTEDFEFELMTKAGKQVSLTMNAATFRDTTGDVAGMVACGQDTTSFRDLADDLTRLINTANAPIFGIDVNGKVSEWNKKAAEISGWSKEEAFGKPLIEHFIAEQYREEVARVLNMALEGHETTNFEFPLFAKNGQRREILLNATTRRSARGDVTGVIGVGQDITELKAIQAEQQRVADDLSRLIETANAPIFGVDVQGRVTEWNRNAAQLSGFSKEETLGRNLVEEFITLDYKAKVKSVLDAACRGEETANFEFPLITKDKKQVEVLLNATARRDANDIVTGMVGVGQDITNLRKAMAKGQRIADDLTRLIDTANAPIFGIDTNGCVTEWNNKAAEISKWTKADALGKPLVKTFITEPFREEVGSVLQMALEGKESSNYEFPLYTKSGLRREILLNATTRRGAHGEVTGVIGVGQDITELKAISAEQQRVADDLSCLIETANAPIFGVDVEGKVTEWNRKAGLISGYLKHDTYRRPFIKHFIHHKHQAAVQEVLDSALRGEEVGNFELPLHTRTGEKRDILLNATPRRGTGGAVVGVFGVGQDITELNAQRREALRIADDLRTIVDTASAPIFGVDADNRITEWNQRVRELTGYPKDEALNQHFNAYLTEGSRQSTFQVLAKAFKGQSTTTFEAHLLGKSNREIVLLLSATPRIGPDNSIIGVICVGQDITYMKDLEVKQSQFMAMVTHELRSPLHGIIGLSETLISDNEDGGNPSQQKLFRMVANCARRLLDLVTNIMDASVLVQENTARMSRDPVQIARICEEVITLVSCAVDKRGRSIKQPGVVLISNVPENLPIIEADAHRCTQLLYNLVTNALKFTEKGHIKVSASADDAHQLLHIDVEDTGIGITSHSLELIFRPFEQEDTSESRVYEGLGLGLSICREVAVKHGGSLTVESEVGKGSTFFVKLPYKMKQAVEAPIGSSIMQGLNQGVATGNSLDDSGAPSPTAAESSEPVGTKLQAPEAENRASDSYNLPWVRGVSDDSHSSGVGEPPVRARPVNLSSDEVMSKVNEVVPRKQWTILSVDDDHTSHESIKALLEGEDCDVVACMTGHECLRYISYRDVLPDVILLDVEMPGMSGVEVLKTLRIKYSLFELPVIMITTSGFPAGMFEANDWILKPFQAAELRQRVKVQCQSRKLTMALDDKVKTMHGILARMLSQNVVEQLLVPGGALDAMEAWESATALYICLIGFPSALTNGTDSEPARLLTQLGKDLEAISEDHGVRSQFLGGGFIAVNEQLRPNEDTDTTGLVMFSYAVHQMVQRLQRSLPEGSPQFEVCIALAAGSLHRGILGHALPQYCLFGAAVLGAQRICADFDLPGRTLLSWEALKNLNPDREGWISGVKQRAVRMPGDEHAEPVFLLVTDGEALPELKQKHTHTANTQNQPAALMSPGPLGNGVAAPPRASFTTEPVQVVYQGTYQGQYQGQSDPMVPTLLLQNSHLQLEVTQMKRRTAMAEASLAEARRACAAGEALASRYQSRIRHLEVDAGIR